MVFQAVCRPRVGRVGPIQNGEEYHVPKKRGQEGGLKVER